jgi:hypothetical protein
MDHQTSAFADAKIGATCTEATPEQVAPKYRRRKSKIDAAKYKSLRTGHQVWSVYGYQPARTKRPETGQEPAFNRPTESDWEPEYPSVRPACFSGEFCSALSGHDPDRVDLHRVGWRGQEYAR